VFYICDNLFLTFDSFDYTGHSELLPPVLSRLEFGSSVALASTAEALSALLPLLALSAIAPPV